jgi:predicted nucleic acid-binding protein
VQLRGLLFQLGITRALEHRVKGVSRLGHMEFTCTVEVFDGLEVVTNHACPTTRATCAEAVADAACQALISRNRSQHRDLKDSIYALYPRKKKDAFKISRVDPQIFRGAMAHIMSLSLDMSDRLLAAQREIHYLRTRLTHREDTLRAHQRI